MYHDFRFRAQYDRLFAVFFKFVRFRDVDRVYGQISARKLFDRLYVLVCNFFADDNSIDINDNAIDFQLLHLLFLVFIVESNYDFCFLVSR